jgi:hypothetical protein
MLCKGLLIGATLAIACGGTGDKGYFGGCIVYETEYQTLAGETLLFAVKPKSWLYVKGNNLKLYDRKKQLEALYLGDKNELYRFEKEQAVLLADTAQPAPRPAQTCLPATATILGYPCQVLRLVQGSSATLVFYSPEVRINVAGFRHCALPGWYALLQATDGALPLRTITVDAQQDITVTREAISIEPMLLAATDFTATAPAR